MLGIGNRDKTKKLRNEVSAKFDALASTQGILFESTQEPITEEEIKTLQKQKRNSLLFINTFPTSFMLLFVVISFSNPEKIDWFEIISTLLIFSALLATFNWLLRKNFNRALKSETKHVYKGVVTWKYKSDYTPYFELSKTERIAVPKADYKNFNIGDIVKIYSYHPKDNLIKKRVVKIANILDL